MEIFPDYSTTPGSKSDSLDSRIVLVGSWPGLAQERAGLDSDVSVPRCDELDELPALVHARSAEWMLAGPELYDTTVQRAVAAASRVRGNIRLAMLGSHQDWRRCERWVRRGCRVYLESNAAPRHALEVMRAASSLGVNIVDRAFAPVGRRDNAGPAPHVTRREQDVLRLLRRGLRNREIAHSLHLSENTIEYHMRHLMSKFGARNRVEVVDRATAFGLA